MRSSIPRRQGSSSSPAITRGIRAGSARRPGRLRFHRRSRPVVAPARPRRGRLSALRHHRRRSTGRLPLADGRADLGSRSSSRRPATRASSSRVGGRNSATRIAPTNGSKAFARTIAEETRRAFEEVNAPVRYEHLIISANEQMFTLLNGELHETIKERVLGQITLPIDANISEITAGRAPRRRGGAATRDGSGAGGSRRSRRRRPRRRWRGGYDHRARNRAGHDPGHERRLSQPGWADYTLPLYGVEAAGGAPSWRRRRQPGADHGRG